MSIKNKQWLLWILQGFKNEPKLQSLKTFTIVQNKNQRQGVEDLSFLHSLFYEEEILVLTWQKEKLKISGGEVEGKNTEKYMHPWEAVKNL